MVILVDTHDNEIGTMEKMAAHREGRLHRAFSVLVFNNKGEMLLQKRAAQKYHSGGLWTNACCSHPLPGENIRDASRRRLKEEMGIDLQPEFSHSFIYKTALDKGLTEHEFDHVFKAIFNGVPDINRIEVEDWKFVDLKWLLEDVRKNPEEYTAWFKIILKDTNFQK